MVVVLAIITVSSSSFNLMAVFQVNIGTFIFLVLSINGLQKFSVKLENTAFSFSLGMSIFMSM